MSQRPIPAGTMLHPIVIAAVLVLLLNDHGLKAAYGAWWTGKLSDVAGLAFFPLLLQAAWELGCAIRRRPWRRSNGVLVAAVLATGTTFALIQLWAPGVVAYEHGLGVLQWIVALPADLLSGEAPGRPHRVVLTADASDLLALPALLVPLWVGWERPEAPDSDVACPARLTTG